MHLKQVPLLLLLLFFCKAMYGQKRFCVERIETDIWTEQFHLVDEGGKVIRKLDTAKYFICFTQDTYVHFAIFGVKGMKGWAAIDAEEKVLFQVYNTSFGEPSPDYLVEDKIRIVDDQDRIGFANSKGEIIIQPQFEAVSTFYKGKAFIGKSCAKVPWGNHEEESGCHHYSLVCKQHGYINTEGKVIKLGNFSLEQIIEEIGWKDATEESLSP